MDKKGVEGRARIFTILLKSAWGGLSRDSVDGGLDPGPGEVVAHGQCDHDEKPEETAGDDNPGQPGTITNMHEIQDDQGCFAHSDCESRDGVESPQVNQSHFDRD